MKLLNFKCIKSDNDCEVGRKDFFIQLETEIEADVYESFLNQTAEDAYVSGMVFGQWSGYMSAKLEDGERIRVSDDDIFYYFMPEEKVPEIGGEFTLDDMVFERIA